MANVERDNNMMNEEQESSQSNSSNGSGATPQQNQSSFQLKSSILRQPATFGSGAGAGGGLFGSGSTALAAGTGGGFNLKPSVLKPSHFGGSAFQNNSSGSGNSFGSNPFLKTQQSEEDPEGEAAAGQQAETSSDGAVKVGKEDGSGGVDPLAALNRSSLPKSNLFANVKSISENKGFVFGQNVHERVTGGENIDVSATPTAGLSFSSTVATTTNNSNDSSSSNSTTPAASTAAATAAGSTGTNNGDKPEATADESLEEAARRYEESRGALKRKFDEVETITGEEDERNVAELNCKLFAFAKSNWEERGHGTLRLNDKDGSSESRVVFRQAGNLRVLINTKVWSGMIAEHSSQKSLRLTAMDNNGQVKVFLLMSRPDVIGKLHKELTKRIQTAKEMAAATGEDDDSKENNDENVSSAAAAKPSEDDDHATATPPVVVVVEKDGAGEDDPPSAKKRLSAAASP
uniref:RanBD1 domain-containing protein n=1 Tax=Culex tarsalis TaxID=7177 RepID=A0A1Q3F5D3_CULTA